MESRAIQTVKHSQASSADRNPAEKARGGADLLACLTLVAPTGLSAEQRSQWLTVAWEEVRHLPADILAIGCKHARQSCQFPSQIVPTILDRTRQVLAWRREGDRSRLPANDGPKQIADLATVEDFDKLLGRA